MALESVKTMLSNSLNAEIGDTKNAKLAAVMIIIYGDDPTMIMTERPKSMNLHAGEISFPGGSWQSQDRDLLETAVRETREEIGIGLSRNSVIGQLNAVTTLNSGFTIMPFISVLDEVSTLNPNSEIASILRIPLLPLFKTLDEDNDPNHKSIQEMYTFRFQDHLIWGASARMIKQILDKLSSEDII